MTILLDTHMFIWATSEPERLGNYREVIEDPTEEVALSVASAWEIAIKHGVGKISLPEQPSSYVTSRIAMLGLRTIDVTLDLALGVESLPLYHRDPFDRLLIATARKLDMRLLTVDRRMEEYDVTVLHP